MDSRAILKGIQTVTHDWMKQKKREEREASARCRRREYLYRERRMTIREAAFEIMQEAYMKASAGGTLPAHARQIMYAARGYILEKTEKKTLDDAYFTQVLLPEYVREHECDDWDVVYDARGHFQEPHALQGEEVALGTLEVRRYLSDMHSRRFGPPNASVGGGGDRYPTRGPEHRYGAILFVEKEGFMPLFSRVELADRFDIALMSTKGFSNVASRHLIDELCGEHDIPLLVLHDFDVSGFGILETLRMGSERYEFQHVVEVIELGLRLNDVEHYRLQSEPAHHRRRFSTAGMTEAEIAYLTKQRVELNAFASDELVEFVESKLKEHGIEKIIPDDDTLVNAYRRAVHVDHLQQTIRRAAEEAHRAAKDARIPKALRRKVKAMLAESRRLSWDAAIRVIAKGQ